MHDWLTFGIISQNHTSFAIQSVDARVRPALPVIIGGLAEDRNPSGSVAERNISHRSERVEITDLFERKFEEVSFSSSPNR